jgi:hypothetical protein
MHTCVRAKKDMDTRTHAHTHVSADITHFNCTFLLCLFRVYVLYVHVQVCVKYGFFSRCVYVHVVYDRFAYLYGFDSHTFCSMCSPCCKSMETHAHATDNVFLPGDDTGHTNELTVFPSPAYIKYNLSIHAHNRQCASPCRWHRTGTGVDGRFGSALAGADIQMCVCAYACIHANRSYRAGIIRGFGAYI